MCAIDLSKAFDKVNHHALYLKLMKRFIPNELLTPVSYTHLTLPTNREV